MVEGKYGPAVRAQIEIGRAMGIFGGRTGLLSRGTDLVADESMDQDEVVARIVGKLVRLQLPPVS